MISRDQKTEPKKAVRLAIYEKSPLYREGLSLLFQRKEFFEVALETGMPSEILDAVEKKIIDFCLFSMYLENTCWDEFWPMFNQIGSKIPVMILNNSLRENLILQAMDEKIQGYFSGELTSDDITNTIHEITNGSFFIPSRKDPNPLNHRKSILLSMDHNRQLTSQERRISEMIMLGLRNKEIGNRLNITEKTVKCHINRIFKKLNIKKRHDLRKDLLQNCRDEYILKTASYRK